ncbi:MAG TPA: hypothetical protein VG937_14045 [Polyangiaceae bacterium]|jgi:hypothetical protein|nr:hypothetical protein [Polyangiaceae bacterium]
MQSRTADQRRPQRRASRRPKRGLLRGLLIALAAAGGCVAAMWVAIHRYDWLGPLVANTLRSILGTTAVAKLEDLVYGVEDRVNRVTRTHDAPKAYWAVPTTSAVAPRKAVDTASKLPAFHPKDPGPALKAWSAPGDGVWVPIVDPRRPEEEPYLYKTLLHPDPTRSWGEVFVVAVDVRRVDVFVVAGSQEPKSDDPKADAYTRVARIPEAQHEELLAAFNGGFMTEHGGYGMKVDDVVLVHPKPNACTLAVYKDGSLRIGTWRTMADSEPEMRWYRQAPACMYEGGKIHPGLTAGSGLKWGATLDGDTVIRRSAVGLSADRQILYVSITNHTTARALADGVHHAGAVDIAQMDVNWSYPKFVLFEPRDGSPVRKAVALASGFEFSEDEYIRKKARRDFFYLVRKPQSSAK